MCVQNQLKEIVKQPDGLADYIRGLSKIRHNCLICRDLRLAERYVDGDLIVLVRVSFIGRTGNVYDAFALHKRQGIGIEDKAASGPLLKPLMRCDEQTVLICDVQSVEVPEGHIPCITRLYASNDVFRLGRHALYFSAVDRRCVLLGGIPDRKLGITGRGFPIRKDKLVSEVIEGGAKVVYGVAQDKADVTGDGLDGLSYETDVVDFGYAMRLGRQDIGLRFTEYSDSRVQITDVLFGTTEF